MDWKITLAYQKVGKRHAASVDGSRPAAANATQCMWVLLLRGSPGALGRMAAFLY